MYQRYLKRLFDVVIGIAAFPIVCGITVIVAPLICLEDGGSVFYRARRRGLNGRIFVMYKFRSMKMNAPDIRNRDNSTYNSPEDPRITRVGRFLRQTSIDEIPQFFNVLKGDMSLVGPRPVTTDRPLSDYDEKRRVRLTVRPGITGYTQAYYRNSVSQEEKLQKDADYAGHVTFWGDVKILIKTVGTVLLRKNIYTNADEMKNRRM
ncbi:sugar transferase [Ruminococcus gauvreauii]|uniref:Sugar transferase n=1 Tax=Ruminococcus gauvreauii TaxID=438033 RepID=A0ABY5VFH7_9FIRM|nr:sugar transferase [Ruminococcus gauvreauii]UWP59067.1 sugar transferase [Ruminococcus gauvreauii]